MAKGTLRVVAVSHSEISSLAKELDSDPSETIRLWNMSSEEAMIKASRKSICTKAAFIDGKLVALWGVIGVYLGSVGYPWLQVSRALTATPFRIAFRYRKELHEMLALFPVLVDAVSVHDTKTLKLLKILGFTLGSPKPLGKNQDMYIFAEKS